MVKVRVLRTAAERETGGKCSHCPEGGISRTVLVALSLSITLLIGLCRLPGSSLSRSLCTSGFVVFRAALSLSISLPIWLCRLSVKQLHQHRYSSPLNTVQLHQQCYSSRLNTVQHRLLSILSTFVSLCVVSVSFDTCILFCFMQSRRSLIREPEREPV